MEEKERTMSKEPVVFMIVKPDEDMVANTVTLNSVKEMPIVQFGTYR